MTLRVIKKNLERNFPESCYISVSTGPRMCLSDAFSEIYLAIDRFERDIVFMFMFQ
jgi:hypothetical protein